MIVQDNLKFVCNLPNGCGLFVETTVVNTHRYWSDEVPCGVLVWDTLVNRSTVLAALVEEERFQCEEYHKQKNERSKE